MGDDASYKIAFAIGSVVLVVPMILYRWLRLDKVRASRLASEKLHHFSEIFPDKNKSKE